MSSSTGESLVMTQSVLDNSLIIAIVLGSFLFTLIVGFLYARYSLAIGRYRCCSPAVLLDCFVYTLTCRSRHIKRRKLTPRSDSPALSINAMTDDTVDYSWATKATQDFVVHADRATFR